MFKSWNLSLFFFSLSSSRCFGDIVHTGVNRSISGFLYFYIFLVFLSSNRWISSSIYYHFFSLFLSSYLVFPQFLLNLSPSPDFFTVSLFIFSFSHSPLLPFPHIPLLTFLHLFPYFFAFWFPASKMQFTWALQHLLITTNLCKQAPPAAQPATSNSGTPKALGGHCLSSRSREGMALS